MAKQQNYPNSSLEEQMNKTDDYEHCFSSLSSIKDITMDASLAAPMSSAPPSHFLQSEPWMGSVTTDLSEQPLLVSDKYALTVDLPVRASPNKCSHCHKIFGTTNALNKHLLTHQQERPHVCPICQRAFKRHDHLNGHMLTHQKRKQYQCVELGCCKSYYDSHSLKRHYTSQHISPLITPMTQGGPPPAVSSTAPWGPVDRASLFFQGSAATSNDHSALFSPPQSTSDKQQKSCDYYVFGRYGDNKGLASQTVSLMNNCPEASLSQPQSLSVLGPWRQGLDKGPCNDCSGELHPSQWSPNPQPQAKAQVQTQPRPQIQLSTQSWDGGIDIPVSDLQVPEQMLSYPQCSGALNTGVDSIVKQNASERTPQFNQRDPVKQLYVQMSSEEDPQDKHPYPCKNIQTSTCSLSIIPPNPAPHAAYSFSHSALTSKPDPGPPPPPPPIVPPALYSAVKAKTSLSRVDIKKRSERRRKPPAVEPPAPPHPSPRPSSLLAPRRPRPRPLHLVSPSQVAMASFSDSISCQPVQGGNNSILGEEPDAIDWIIPNFQHALKGKVLVEPSGASIDVECDSPESQHTGPQVERSSTQSELMVLSPLVIPVSVPVSLKTEADTLGQRERSGSSADSGSRNTHRSRRLDFMTSLVIPPPMLPPPSPRRLLVDEAMGGAWCRAAGGYPSQLRSPMYLADHLLNPSSQPPPYTPPPMLSPLRPGTGLYFSTLPPLHPCPPLSTYTATLDGADGISLMMDDTVVNIKPRINVGQRFQAEIPPIRSMLLMMYEEHPAQLVWAPWGDMSTNTDTQKRVAELMDLCCSSVLPGGGTNTELALHCLHEVQGDILAALDLLLIRGDYRSSAHRLSDYHYPGSDLWTPLEKRLFCKALQTHEKDFQLIHSVLQTKSVSQCVEYYYGMKRLKTFKQRSSNRGAEKEGADADWSPDHIEENPLGRRGPRRTAARPDHRPAGQPEEHPTSGGALEYTCRECGRVFDRIKSRSAHMKSHRQQERQWLTRYSWSTGSPAEELDQDPTHSSHPAPLLLCSTGILYST